MPHEETIEQRRAEIVEAAAQLIVEEGAHGLSLRQLARQVGGSTQLIYTLFGGKPGLADALYAEGFRRISAVMLTAVESAIPAGDPERLIAMGHAYRNFARDEPAMFSVMFGRAIQGFTPTGRTRDEGRSALFGHVVIIARECIEAGTLVGDDPSEIARSCWVTAHGIASLESARLLGPEDRDAFVDRALRRTVDLFRPEFRSVGTSR